MQREVDVRRNDRVEGAPKKNHHYTLSVSVVFHPLAVHALGMLLQLLVEPLPRSMLRVSIGQPLTRTLLARLIGAAAVAATSLTFGRVTPSMLHQILRVASLPQLFPINVHVGTRTPPHKNPNLTSDGEKSRNNSNTSQNKARSARSTVWVLLQTLLQQLCVAHIREFPWELKRIVESGLPRQIVSVAKKCVTAKGQIIDHTTRTPYIHCRGGVVSVDNLGRNVLRATHKRSLARTPIHVHQHARGKVAQTNAAI